MDNRSNYFDEFSAILSKEHQSDGNNKINMKINHNAKEDDQNQLNSLQQTNTGSNSTQKSNLKKNYFHIKEDGNHYDNIEEYSQEIQENNSELNIQKYRQSITKPLIAPFMHTNSIMTELSDLLNGKAIEKDFITKHKTITITEIEGKQLKNKGYLTINAGGLIDGARGKKDGVALFGWSIKNSSGNIINDFAFSSDINGSRQEIPLFLIYFNQTSYKYFIRTYYNSPSDLMSNQALNPFMVRINKKFKLQSIEFLMIGDMFFITTIDKVQGELCITKKKSKKYPSNFKHTFKNNCNKAITIGRNNTCTLPFQDDKSFSKIHCSLIYSPQEQSWYINDGIENKPSTNGIWIIPKKSFEIYDSMWFKILGSTKCQINFS